VASTSSSTMRRTRPHKDGDISDEEWEKTFRTNIHPMFYLTKAAVLHMNPVAPMRHAGRGDTETSPSDRAAVSGLGYHNGTPAVTTPPPPR
jgi:NAD(P)-dependent dehydrogenase (short-subunit alcohol dehydrogenase family)